MSVKESCAEFIKKLFENDKPNIPFEELKMVSDDVYRQMFKKVAESFCFEGDNGELENVVIHTKKFIYKDVGFHFVVIFENCFEQTIGTTFIDENKLMMGVELKPDEIRVVFDDEIKEAENYFYSSITGFFVEDDDYYLRLPYLPKYFADLNKIVENYIDGE